MISVFFDLKFRIDRVVVGVRCSSIPCWCVRSTLGGGLFVEDFAPCLLCLFEIFDSAVDPFKVFTTRNFTEFGYRSLHGFFVSFTELVLVVFE